MAVHLLIDPDCTKRKSVFHVKISLILLALLFSFVKETYGSCKLVSDIPEQKNILSRLGPLMGKTLTATLRDSQGAEVTVFKVGVCVDPESKQPEAGVVNSNGTSFGNWTKTRVSSNKNYIQLSYSTTPETSFPDCNATGRTSNIMFICDPDKELGELVVLEVSEKTPLFCSYSFAVGSRYACTLKEGLSGGSIFCILFFTGVSLYLLLGFLYQRLLVGAKGLEQIPNFTFWRDFGNLQADGCDFLCRCGSRQEAHSYRGIDERLPRDDERDDQLLNM